MKPLRDAYETIRDCLQIAFGTHKRPWYVWAGEVLLVPVWLLAG